MSPLPIHASNTWSLDQNPPQTVEVENPPPPEAPRPDDFSIPSALGGLREILGDAARTVLRVPRFFSNVANAAAETAQARARRAEWNSAIENVEVAANLAALAEILGRYEEYQNDASVLNVALAALETWGTGDADLHRELSEHCNRLSQALDSGDEESIATAENDALAWIPHYANVLLRVGERDPAFYHYAPRELLGFLSGQPPEEITVSDVATLALEAAFQPYHTGDGYGFLHTMTASVERGDYRLAEWSQAYRDTVRHWLGWRLDEVYGRQALEAGLPPRDESHGDEAIALASYFSRPVADAYAEFRSQDYEDTTSLFTDFQRLVRMASVTDRMNALWDTREITGQFDTQDSLRWNELLWFSPAADHLDQPIGPWDGWFVDSDYFERMRDFSEECSSRLGLLEGMLATLARAETPNGRVAALREADGLQAGLEERFGTDQAFYDQLPRTVQDLVENNAARNQMSSLLETVAVSVFTFGTAAILRNLAQAGRTLPWAFRAGQMTRLGRVYSWARDAALFEGSSVALDAALDPGRRVSPESSSEANIARNVLGYVETVGLFGVLHVLGTPFQAAENRIREGLRLASGLGERLSLYADDGIVRLSRLGTELGGMAAYNTAFESTIGQVRGVWGDDTQSFAENVAQFFGGESLVHNLAMIGVMRAVGIVGETLTPRNALGLALLPLGLCDGGLSLAMAAIRRSGGLNTPFYDYDATTGRAPSDVPMVMIPWGPSGRTLIRHLNTSRSSWRIGRGSEAEVQIPSQFQTVSGTHATIERVTDASTGEVRWELVDHSTNGTTVDGVDVSGRRVTLLPGGHELVLGRNATIHLLIPTSPRPPSPGLLRRIGNVARQVLMGPLWLFRGPDVVSHNLSLLASPEFHRVLSTESFGGNAGSGRVGVNIAVDAEGRIVAIGNIQSLSPEVRQALHEGRYLRVTLSLDFQGRIDWERCVSSDPISDAVKATLRRSVEEYNTRIASGTDGASGMIAPVFALSGLSTVLPGLSDAFSFSPFLAGLGLAAAVVVRRAYDMSDRNRRENRMADSLTQTTHRRLRDEAGLEIPLEEIQEIYHSVIAADFKTAAGGRRNVGDLTTYAAQEEALFAYFTASRGEPRRLSSLEDRVNRFLADGLESLNLSGVTPADAKILLDAERPLLRADLQALLDQETVSQYESLQPKLQSEFEEGWRLRLGRMVDGHYNTSEGP